MTQLYAFDLGDTLVEYEGLPLSWEAHYPAALSALAGHCGIEADAETIARGIAVLKRYNTRLVPRMHEVEFRTILSELFENLEATAELDEVECARAFFAL